ncbi:MAG: SRPBCC family protein [Acidobacteriia bacterium]|nr:SRPBCC family protein [Terriglobia bacterium]
MAQIETSVEIAAPAELVFAFFVPQRMPYWYGADMEACLEVQGGAPDFAVSQKVRVTGHLGKREVSHTSVVTALQPARVFEWRFEDRYGVKGLERWEFERLAGPTLESAPRTIVRMRSAYTMPGLLGKAMDWLMTRHAVAKRNQDYLARLKGYAEHGEPE